MVPSGVSALVGRKHRYKAMSNDPTKPEFFALWSLRQLQVECARLNKLLVEVSEIAEKQNPPKNSRLEKK